MSLKIVSCEEPTLNSFCNNILKEDNVMKHICLEEIKSNKSRRPNALVLGKIVKVLSFSPEAGRFIILVKEFLPSWEYGGKFKALVEGRLASKLAGFSPQTGDRVAFFEPFVYLNPAFEPENHTESKVQPKYILFSKYDETALMWFAKKQEMGGKSDGDKNMQHSRNLEKGKQINASSTSRLRQNEPLLKTSTSCQLDSRGDSLMQTSSNIRHKPLIQLPQKPQIPVNTKRLNPQYTYKTISSITSDPPSREQSINIFGVVDEIVKPVTTTSKNKHTMVCILADDSDEKKGKIKFHFFTSEDTILSQIKKGDILRLHRAKIERFYFNDQLDGRVFFSHDIVLFKKDCPDNKPITVAKNTTITDEEKERVATLKKWYKEHLQMPILLSDICESGKYDIFCKIVKHEPKIEGGVVKITITDGSAIKALAPATPLERYNEKRDGKMDHIVTEIISHSRLDEYARLEKGDFVLFSDVEAVPLGNDKFRLEIHSDTLPEIVAEKTLRVADIECRIAQFLKNPSKKIESKEPSYVEISDQEIEPSVKTKQQKVEQKSSAGKSENKSVPPDNYDNEPKDDSDTRNTESDPGTKTRKQLFTPNYTTDLSDAATDETSVHNVDMSKHSSNKQPDEEIVNPKNRNFNDLQEKVITKYCRPMKKDQNQHSTSRDKEGMGLRSSSLKVRGSTNQPLVLLKRLCVNEGLRKTGMNTPGMQDDIDDAETVVNISCQSAALDRSRQGIKRIRLESLSTEAGNLKNDDEDINQELEDRGVKVTSWLFHPNNKIPTISQEDTSNVECDIEVFKHLVSLDGDAQDMSKYTSSKYFRVRAFLLKVIPDPLSNPLDLVSGYCHSGCKKVFLCSAIRWQFEENTTLPLCPACIKLEEERELQLMLVMELIVMDPSGQHASVIVCRDHAEQFLNCSVEEYLKDSVTRKSRVQLLTDYTMQNTSHARVTPQLDIGVCPIKDSPFLYLLVNSTLKLPRL